MPWSCVRGARGRFGGVGAGAGCCVFPVFPSCPACPALCVAGPPVRVFLILARWYAIPCGLCVLRARSGCPSGFPRVSFVSVCARALAASRCWALVGPFLSVRAPPRVLPRSRAPFGLLGGGGGAVPFPPSWLGAARSSWGGWGRGNPSPTPPRALLLAWRAVGAARGRLGGASLALARGVRGRALSQPRQLVLLGVRPGRTTHWLWVRRVRAWGPVTNPAACALASWLCALWGRHEGAWGGRLLPGCGVSGVRPSPTPDLSFVRVCGWGRLPTGCGCEGCRRGDPSPTPQRALLQAGFAHCGGGMRVPGGGPLAWVWGVRGRALSHPRPLVRSGVRPGPTTHWLWVPQVRAWGPVTNPTAHASASWLCALWGRLEAARGGAPLAWVWDVRGRALSHPRPLVPSGVRPGPTTHWLWLRGMRA